MTIGGKARNLVPLPNGTDVSAYEGWENWNYRRWAWEFLRRNDDFRTACCELKKIHGEDRKFRKQEIAKKFMLKNFSTATRKSVITQGSGFLPREFLRPVRIQSTGTKVVSLARERGIAELKSHVYKTNRRSIAFHRKLGFHITRENEKAIEFFASISTLSERPAVQRAAWRADQL